MGGGSIFGPESCSYFAKPEVAELSADNRGNIFMATLVGEGTVTKTCGETKISYDVRTATAARIKGPGAWKIGAPTPTARLEFIPLAGSRELLGVRSGSAGPDWSLGNDCAGVATFAPVLGAQDTGGADVSRSLVATKPGTCTISATMLGVTATKTVKVQ